MPIELEAFFALAEKWELSTDEQIRLLGSPGRSTYFKWKKEGGIVPVDTLERISHALGIWKSLQILFTSEERGNRLVEAPKRVLRRRECVGSHVVRSLLRPLPRPVVP